MPAPFTSYPYDASGIDTFAHPLFLGDNQRAPTTNDLQNPGTQWLDRSVSPAVLYITTGGGIWYSVVGAGASFTTLAVSGDATIGGNLSLTGTAKQLRVEGGAVTDFIGTATLAAGTVTVLNTNIAATDRIFIQRIAANSSTTMGELSYTISAATSFTINALILGTPGSVQTGDLSTVAYFIVRQL